MVSKVALTDDLPRAQLEILGRLLIRFGQLEYLLKLIIKRLGYTSFDEGMAAADKIEKIRELRDKADELYGVRNLDQKKEAEFRKLIDEAVALYAERNRLYHGLIAKGPGGTWIFRHKDRTAPPDAAALLRRARAIIPLLDKAGRPTKHQIRQMRA